MAEYIDKVEVGAKIQMMYILGGLKMTIDEAIKYYLEGADQEEQLSKTGKWFEGEDWNVKVREYHAECAADHRQLAEWLRELRKAKRILKSATKILTTYIPCDDDYCSECDRSVCDYDDSFHWLYKDEALALIGEDGDINA